MLRSSTLAGLDDQESNGFCPFAVSEGESEERL